VIQRKISLEKLNLTTIFSAKSGLVLLYNGESSEWGFVSKHAPRWNLSPTSAPRHTSERLDVLTSTKKGGLVGVGGV
jgi:hypothetical protein